MKDVLNCTPALDSKLVRIQWYCKLQNILPTFHVPSFYNKLHLVDALSSSFWCRKIPGSDFCKGCATSKPEL